MDIDVLNEFVTIARYESFSDAAVQLNLTQPTLSKHMAVLERQLGYALIERDSRNFSLTVHGQLFYETAVEMLNVYHQGLNRLKKVQSRSEVKVSGALGSPAVSNLLAKIGQFSGIARINVCKNVKLPFDVALMERRVDVCFSPVSPSLVGFFKDLEFIPVAHERALAVVSPSSSLWDRESVSFSELEDKTFIRVSEGFQSEPGWESIEEMCRIGGYDPRTRYYFNDINTLSLDAEDVFILPESVGKLHVAMFGSDNYRAIPLTDDFAFMDTFMIARRAERSHAANEFIVAARSIVGDLSECGGE